MKATRWLSLALTTGVIGSMVGCANPAPTLSPPSSPIIPQAQPAPQNALPPDQVLTAERTLMVNGKAMTMDEIRQHLPSRIPAADAAKVLVQIDPDKIVKEAASNELETQQWWFFRRGYFARGFFGGWPLFSSSLFAYPYAYYPFAGYYWPYYLSGGFYYPFSYASFYYPYLYGYGGLYYPFYFRRFWW